MPKHFYMTKPRRIRVTQTLADFGIDPKKLEGSHFMDNKINTSNWVMLGT